MKHSDPQSNKISAGDIALYGGIAATGAVIAAPYALPLLGFGANHVGDMLNICSQGAGEFGKGLAGTINTGFSQFGEIGHSLALGGWSTTIASGFIGLGGVMLGNYIEEKFDKEGQIPWGKIIKYAAMTTSILIALPSLLSAISMGVTFLTLAFGGAVAGTAVGTAMSGTLGYMGGMQALNAGAGLAGLLPHFFTCVLGTLPVISTLLAGHNNHEKPQNTLRTVDFRERLQQVHQAAVTQ